MNRQKIVFIIPAFSHKTTSKGYKELARLLRREGYKPLSISITWKGSTILDNTKHFLSLYRKMLSKFGKEKIEVYLFGFSFGALIALIVSTKISVKGLLLCSLSPFFKEDLPKKLPAHASDLQIKRHAHFSQLHWSQISKKVKARKVMMLYGEKESKPLIARVTKTFRKIPSAKKYLFSMKDMDHTISAKKYLSAIHYATAAFL